MPNPVITMIYADGSTEPLRAPWSAPAYYTRTGRGHTRCKFAEAPEHYTLPTAGVGFDAGYQGQATASWWIIGLSSDPVPEVNSDTNYGRAHGYFDAPVLDVMRLPEGITIANDGPLLFQNHGGIIPPKDVPLEWHAFMANRPEGYAPNGLVIQPQGMTRYDPAVALPARVRGDRAMAAAARRRAANPSAHATTELYVPWPRQHQTFICQLNRCAIMLGTMVAQGIAATGWEDLLSSDYYLCQTDQKGCGYKEPSVFLPQIFRYMTDKNPTFKSFWKYLCDSNNIPAQENGKYVYPTWLLNIEAMEVDLRKRVFPRYASSRTELDTFFTKFLPFFKRKYQQSCKRLTDMQTKLEKEREADAKEKAVAKAIKETAK